MRGVVSRRTAPPSGDPPQGRPAPGGSNDAVVEELRQIIVTLHAYIAAPEGDGPIRYTQALELCRHAENLGFAPAAAPAPSSPEPQQRQLRAPVAEPVCFSCGDTFDSQPSWTGLPAGWSVRGDRSMYACPQHTHDMPGGSIRQETGR